MPVDSFRFITTPAVIFFRLCVEIIIYSDNYYARTKLGPTSDKYAVYICNKLGNCRHQAPVMPSGESFWVDSLLTSRLLGLLWTNRSHLQNVHNTLQRRQMKVKPGTGTENARRQTLNSTVYTPLLYARGVEKFNKRQPIRKKKSQGWQK